MLVKKRKRKLVLSHEFTVVAKDGASVEIIEQQARQKKIEVFRRGHAKNRLYFRCMPEQWDGFSKNISDLCFWESAVTPPGSILRRYRRNLLKTAVNRLNKTAAQAALKVLTEKSSNKDNFASSTQNGTEPATTSLYNNSVLSIKQSPKSIKLKSVTHGLKNYISRLRYFIKPKKFAGTAHA